MLICAKTRCADRVQPRPARRCTSFWRGAAARSADEAQTISVRDAAASTCHEAPNHDDCPRNAQRAPDIHPGQPSFLTPERCQSPAPVTAFQDAFCPPASPASEPLHVLRPSAVPAGSIAMIHGLSLQLYFHVVLSPSPSSDTFLHEVVKDYYRRLCPLPIAAAFSAAICAMPAERCFVRHFT